MDFNRWQLGLGNDLTRLVQFQCCRAEVIAALITHQLRRHPRFAPLGPRLH